MKIVKSTIYVIIMILAGYLLFIGVQAQENIGVSENKESTSTVEDLLIKEENRPVIRYPSKKTSWFNPKERESYNVLRNRALNLGLADRTKTISLIQNSNQTIKYKNGIHQNKIDGIGTLINTPLPTPVVPDIPVIEKPELSTVPGEVDSSVHDYLYKDVPVLEKESLE